MQPPSRVAPNERPGALAGATGAENVKAGELRLQDSPKPRRLSTSKHSELRHRSAARGICKGLILGEDYDAWARVANLLSIRLTEVERGMIAWAVLKAGTSTEQERLLDALSDALSDPEPPVEPHVLAAIQEYRRQQGLASFRGAGS